MSGEMHIVTYDPQTENYRVDAPREGETLEQALQRVGGWLHPNVAPTRIGLNFGDALCALKAGDRVAREGWNGKGMWLALSCGGSREVHYTQFWSPVNAAYALEGGGYATVLPCITMKTATGEILMGWLASQTDMLATDWGIVS